MVTREECVAFRNREGIILRGIVNHGVENRGVSLIFLNTGLNDMVGWHRLQVKMARFFAQRGYNVLRFDDAGIGDSGGDLDEPSIVNVFAQIETGLFKPNADAAIDFVEEKFADEEIVYLGFCGGGLTALHSAADNPRVSGVINIAGPITLSSNEYLYKADPWEVKRNVAKYREKFFKLEPWINFWTGRGEYQTVFRSIIHYIRHGLKGEYKESADGVEVKDSNNLNHTFFNSFEKYRKTGRPLLFYFAELDSATWEFKKYFLPQYPDINTSISDSLFSFVEVEKANHIFSTTESQDKMKEDLSWWMEQFFPGSKSVGR